MKFGENKMGISHIYEMVNKKFSYMIGNNNWSFCSNKDKVKCLSFYYFRKGKIKVYSKEKKCFYVFFFVGDEIKMKQSFDRTFIKEKYENEKQAKEWWQKNLEEIQNCLSLSNENESETMIISEKGIFGTNEEGEREQLLKPIGFNKKYIDYLINVFQNLNIEVYEKNNEIIIPVDDE